jgi:hypothetical protein
VCGRGIVAMWPNTTWGFVGLAGVLLLTAVWLPPSWVGLSRWFLAAAIICAVLAAITFVRRSSAIK